MSFDLKSYMSKRASDTQQTMLGLCSWRSYLKSIKDKILKFCSQDTVRGEPENMSVPVYNANLDESIIALVDSNQYNAIMDDPEGTIVLPVNSQGTMMTFNKSDVMESIENMIQEGNTQYEFLDYCLTSETVSTSQMFSYLRSKYEGISSSVLEKYSQYCISGSPLTAIQNYLTSIKLGSNNTPETESSYITVSTVTEYTGASVWEVIWADFSGMLKTTLIALGKFIASTGQMVKELLEAVGKLVIWVAKKVFAPLFTNFTKGDAKLGILDIPLIQFKLGILNEDYNTISFNGKILRDWLGLDPSKLFYGLVVSGRGGYACANKLLGGGDPGDVYVREINYEYDSWDSVPGVNFNAIIWPIINSCIRYDEDGNRYVRPYDVVYPIPYDKNWPDQPDSMIIRVGIDESRQVWIQFFCSLPQSFLEGTSDNTIYENIRSGFWNFFNDITIHSPFWMRNNPGMSEASYGTYTQFNVAFSHLRDNLLTPLSAEEEALDGPLDILPHLSAFDADDILSDFLPGAGTTVTPAFSFARFMCMSVLPYIYLNCSDLPNDAGELTISNNIGFTALWNGLTSTKVVPDGWASSYRPYVPTDQTTVSVHYQTLRERATELEKYIITLVVAVAVVASAIAISKFRKRRIAKYEVAQGYVDNMSWNLPQNPTDQQLNDYLKAKKKANRILRHNGLLGINTPTSNTSSIIAGISSVKDQLLANQGITESSTSGATNLVKIDSDVSSIIDLIH